MAYDFVCHSLAMLYRVFIYLFILLTFLKSQILVCMKFFWSKNAYKKYVWGFPPLSPPQSFVLDLDKYPHLKLYALKDTT